MRITTRIALLCASVLLHSSFLSAQETATNETAQQEFIDAALRPFWKATRIREPLFFIQSFSASRPPAALLFRPDTILKVESATREQTFELGRDYQFNEATNSIWLPVESRIPFIATDELYPLMSSDLPKIKRQQGDPERGIYFDNEAGYHKRQVEVTYDFAPGQWNGPVPAFAGADLPLLMAKLQAKKPLRILLSGDSISAGYNASQFTKSPPGCPAYGELVALALAEHSGCEVNFTNHAVGGWNAARGLQQAVDERLGEQRPDLVIIAFGMNDVFAKDAQTYQKNVQAIMETIRKTSPETEFILVASMLGNTEWGMPMEQFDLYRNALRELCGPGVVLADLTSIWKELLKHKSFYDLTGNGVNHPNDFGHIVYAQVILSLLIDDLPPTEAGKTNSKGSGPSER